VALRGQSPTLQRPRADPLNVRDGWEADFRLCRFGYVEVRGAMNRRLGLVAEWRKALPTLLWTSGILWVGSWLVALVRGGFNTHDPLEIAFRLLLTAALCIAIPPLVVLTVLLPARAFRALYPHKRR
jgi:hypothetical protein